MMNMRVQGNDQPSMLMKIVFVGDSGVGKTSLINREYDDTFIKEHLATIGVDFRIKNYDLGLIKAKVQLWDTAGQERFKSIQKPYYKNAKAVCLCFSLNSKQSFLNLPKWITNITELGVETENVILIGCKSDLDIEVATDEILVFASQRSLMYHETSSKTGQGVHEAFQNLVINCAQRQIKNSALNKKQQNKIIGEELNNKNKSISSVSSNQSKKLCCGG